MLHAPMMGSNTSVLSILPGIASSPYSSPTLGSCESSTLKQLKRKMASVRRRATICESSLEDLFSTLGQVFSTRDVPSSSAVP